MILKAVVNFSWFDIDYTSIQWLIKMNINSYVNKVWTERVNNKFRQQFDKVLEKYQATTMHRALSRHLPFLLLITFSFQVFVVVFFPLSLSFLSLFLYIFIIYTHTSWVSHAIPSFWYIETLIHPFPEDDTGINKPLGVRAEHVIA